MVCLILYVVNGFVPRFCSEGSRPRYLTPLVARRVSFMLKCIRPQIYVVNALVQALPGTHKERIPSKADVLYKVIQTVVYDCDRKCAQTFSGLSDPLCSKCVRPLLYVVKALVPST